MHDPDHSFEDIGPLYEEEPSSLHSEPDDSSSLKEEQAGIEDREGDEGDAASSNEVEAPVEEASDEEFDPDVDY